MGHSLYRATVKEGMSRDCHDIRACFDALIIDKKRIDESPRIVMDGGKIQYIWYNQYETTFHEISMELWPSAQIFLRRMKRKRETGCLNRESWPCAVFENWRLSDGRSWTKEYEPGSWGWSYHVSWYFQFSIPGYILTFRGVIFLHVIRWDYIL